MSSIYDMFDVDKKLEKEGIIVNYGDVRFVIARAGGSNKKFRDVFAARSKPYQRQMANDQLAEEVAAKLLAQVYAESVILRIDARSKETPEGAPEEWLESQFYEREGTLVEDTVKNRVELLTNLPELFTDLQSMATKAANFRTKEIEETEGN